MKKLIYSLAIATLVLTLPACSGKKKTTTQSKSTHVEQTALSVDNAMDQAEKWLEKSIEVEGVVAHVCERSGTKLFLMGSDDKHVLRVNAGKLGKFPKSINHKRLIVEGSLKEDRIDEAYLTNWEEQIKNETEEHHGEDEGGCESEKAARGEKGDNSNERIANFRKRIAERKAKEGKAYLSFYYVEAQKYEIVSAK
jgi:hypothetical protein